MNYKRFPIFIFALLAIGLNSCGVYSFTGASIPPDVRTISFQSFLDNSGGGPPTLSQNFTEKIKEFYQRNTNLAIVADQGDLQLEGTIVAYNLTPIAPQAGANESAALNRLTISVKTKFVNLKNEEQNFENTFTAYEDFPQSRSLSQEESRLIEIISDRIILDIFNKSVANW